MLVGFPFVVTNTGDKLDYKEEKSILAHSFRDLVHRWFLTPWNIVVGHVWWQRSAQLRAARNQAAREEGAGVPIAPSRTHPNDLSYSY